MSEQKDCLIAHAAMLAGTLILENGGETYRAEETAYHVCRAGGIDSPQIIALPTGIFVNGNQRGRHEQHGFMRIHQSTVHLYKLEKTNRYCREFVRGERDAESLLHALTELRASTVTIPFLRSILISGLTTAAFAVMLDGGIHDIWIALLCGFLLTLCTAPLAKSTISTVTVNMVGGAVIALTAVCMTHLIGQGTPDIIIVSGIMPILPGLATLNAVRDAMCGDLVSSNARLLKAMLIAISIAAGVGMVLAIYLSLGGTL